MLPAITEIKITNYIFKYYVGKKSKRVKESCYQKKGKNIYCGFTISGTGNFYIYHVTEIFELSMT